MDDQFPERLKLLLRGKLPGEEAHQRMMSYRRSSAAEAVRQNPEPRMGAVLLALYKDLGAWNTILIERPVYEGTHSGQLAFPGGKWEQTDPDLSFTALRESEEEIGLLPDRVEILGALTDIYIPPSNFLVKPFVGYVKSLNTLVPDPREVASILHTPLELFFDPQSRKEKEIELPYYNTTIRAPYYDVHSRTLWGATAMMISEFIELSTQPR